MGPGDIFMILKCKLDKPFNQTTIGLQMGTNKGASQEGMLAPGTRRDIYDQKLTLQPVDNSTISLQMGTNKVTSQTGSGGKYMIPNTVLFQQNLSFTTEAKEQEQMGQKSVIVIIRQNTQMSVMASANDHPRDYHYGDQGIGY
ncbi:hypothetical protein mRhiFer1_009813 [Rhinolophus ferrumequinum]|uniref:Calponin 3 n=1 Tax=Rhinolophus ferrumequinum TaxID=59479 RepID=A0A7J7YRZ4_RHIFE|nr:hypothetical protein mRhiFer1_009813 [Rhinolophus ferrumequinum]